MSKIIKQDYKETKAITLVALVITIIILLILVAISVSALGGNNGIIEKANYAKVRTENSAVAEGFKLKMLEYQGDGESDILVTLINEEIIDGNGKIDTYKLLGQNISTGQGSDNKDIYVLEENNLYYYDKDGNKSDLGYMDDINFAKVDLSDIFYVDDYGYLKIKDYEKKSDNPYYYLQSKFVWNIENLVIPTEIDGKTVKYIYLNPDELGRTSIPGIDKLKSVYIPDGIIAISPYAFMNATNLTSVRLPEGLLSIGQKVFYKCSSLTNIEIPASVTNIANTAFCNCSNLSSITVKEGNKIYDSRDNCNAIIKKASNELVIGSMSTVIPNGVVKIGEEAFLESGITSITIPSSVTTIGESAFEYCTNLSSITIPSSVDTIGAYAFYYCTNLSSISIPSSVTSMGGNVFYRWESNQTINIEAASIPSTWYSSWNSSCNATINTNVKM